MSIALKEASTTPAVISENLIRTTVALLDKDGTIIEEILLNGGVPDKEEIYNSAVRHYLTASSISSFGEIEEITVVYKGGSIRIIVDEDMLRVAASTGHIILS